MEETKEELENRLKKLKHGAPLPPGYRWESNGCLRGPKGHFLKGFTGGQKKLDEDVTLQSQLLKYSGNNLNNIFKKIAEIAKGTDPTATKLQFDACKYIIDLYYNKEILSKNVNHNLEISFDENLLKIAEKTKKQKEINDIKKDYVVDVN